jgi:crotonobetainyl-CoA:carnitine CoA-transferase CaiB-like acyl-CoA transferase
LLDDPRFADDLLRGKNSEILSAVMSVWCASRTAKEALAELEVARIPAGPVFSPGQALADDAMQSRGLFCMMDYPGLLQPVPLVTSPANLSRTPPQIRTRAPVVGEHTDEILAEAGYGRDAIEGLRASGII